MLTVDINGLKYSLDSLSWIPFTAYKELRELVDDATEVCIVKNGNYAVFMKNRTGCVRSNCPSNIRHGLKKNFIKIIKD